MATLRIFYKTALEDLEKVIAQETCGLTDVTPEQDDRDLAGLFVKIINHDARFAISRDEFETKVLGLLDAIVKEAVDGS